MADALVICPYCQKQYRFNQALVGKKLVCKGCESVMRMPAFPGNAQEVRPSPKIQNQNKLSSSLEPKKDQTGYELDLDLPEDHASAPQDAPASASHAGQCPSCNGPMKPTAVVCMNCGFNTAQGKKMATQVSQDLLPQAATQTTSAAPLDQPVTGSSIKDAQVQRMQKRKQRDSELEQDAAHRHRWQDYTLPRILIGAGIVMYGLYLLSLLLYNTADVIGKMVIKDAIVLFVGQIPIAFVGLLIVAKLFGSNFGTLTVAMTKLVALILTVNGISCLIYSILLVTIGQLGPLVGSLLVFCIEVASFLGLSMKLFDMDINETVVLYVLIYFLAPLVFTGLALIGLVTLL